MSVLSRPLIVATERLHAELSVKNPGRMARGRTEGG